MKDNAIKICLPTNLPPGAKPIDVQSLRKVIERSRRKRFERSLKIKHISPPEPIDLTKLKSNRLSLPEIFGREFTDVLDYVDYDKLTPDEERRRAMASEHRKVFNCCFCSFTTDEQTSYKLHIATHLKKKRMECKLCNFSTEIVSIFNKHLNEAHGRNVPIKMAYACPKCTYRSFSLETLIKHKELTGHGGRKHGLIKCKLCNFVSANVLKLAQHVNEHSRASEPCSACDDLLDDGDTMHSVNCVEVTDPLTYKYVESLDTTLKKSYTCTLCEFECGELLFLLAHIQAHVKSSFGDEDSDNMDMPFCCTMCDFQCVLPFKLVSHMKVHDHMSFDTSQSDLKGKLTANYNFSCPFCSERFKTQRELISHSPVHTNFVCKICYKILPSKKRFLNHMTQHEEENAELFPCPFCTNKCQSTDKLRIHLATHHMSEFICNFCNFRCFAADRLIQHMEKHSMLVKHQCDVCLLTFPTDEALQLHRKDFVAGEGFKCDVCCLTYSCNQSLARHKVNHSMRNFPCPTCPAIYSSRISLKIHMIEVHGADAQTTVPETAKPIRIKTNLMRTSEDSGSEMDHVTTEQEIVEPFN